MYYGFNGKCYINLKDHIRFLQALTPMPLTPLFFAVRSPTPSCRPNSRSSSDVSPPMAVY